MQKVLVVIDMQKDFVDGALGSAQAQMIVDNVRQKIENHDGPIIFTRDTHCLLYTSPSPRDKRQSRMPSSA